MKPEISIIIVNYNTCVLLETCLSSIRQWTDPDQVEVIVVDNASADRSAEMVEARFPEARLIRSRSNLGFGKANNLGASRAKGRYLFLLNSDAQLISDTPGRLLSFMDSHPDAGVSGPDIHLVSGTRQPRICGFFPSVASICKDSLMLGTLFPRWKAATGMNLESPDSAVTPVDWVTGACMMIRKQAFDAVDGFDPSFFLYTEDVDLCHRIGTAGWLLYHVCESPILHLCGGSTSAMETRVRNSVLQQHYFLKLIKPVFSGMEFKMAKLILGLGLGFRFFAGIGLQAIQPDNDHVLTATSLDRLRHLLTGRSRFAGGFLENRY